MQKEKIEQLREIINKMIISENYDYNKLLKKSQELDKLLVEVVKEGICTSNVMEEELKNKLGNIIDKIRTL